MDRRTWKEPVDQRIVAEAVYLEHGELLRIERADRLLIGAHAGSLWITQDGNSGDLLIAAGQCHRLQGDGLAIVHALAPTSVTISAPLDAPRGCEIERILPNGTRIALSRRKRGHPAVRKLTAAWLRLYRAGRRSARRTLESSRHAAAAHDFTRFAARLDPRTRRDIGLEAYVPSPGERAERYRWLHDLHGAPRPGAFL